MAEFPKEKRLLFLHTDPGNPTTQRRTRSKSLDSKVRRHLMVDIGKSRRKPLKEPQFVTFVWSLAKTSADQGEHSTSRDAESLQLPAKDLVVRETAAQYPALSTTTPPVLHALSIFEKEWGEDSISAYGFTLIMVAGRNAMGSKLRSLALERSLETIQCVESRLSSSDASSATSDGVLHAVLALVCYNFTSLDFDQAMIHVKGMWAVIAARGGISTLEANRDLMLMILWVDVTAALLHDTKPIFPLSAPVASASVFSGSGLETLPDPLLSVINDENRQDTRFMSALSCIGDLNALAALVRFELATKGNAIWDDEEWMGILMNPVTHQLLDQSSRSQPVTRCDIISEALRLGAVLWIIRVKRRCRSYPGTAEERISRLLKTLSSESNAEQVWNSPGLRLVRLWLLVLCSIGEPSDEDLATSRKMIASEMKQPRLVSWVEIMADVRQMPWVDIFDPPLDNSLTGGLAKPVKNAGLLTSWHCRGTRSRGTVTMTNMWVWLK
ncbi:hypothetical protein B0T26DRAFT_769787 [Lasiosphaeria miniovina]|uniref:Uncharacterized protein n=1 Tax=Lasiosphaeria miniovina TaxID=1954250 RepID=A0AA40ATT9_9PEZI|nr:uncharacterized protein B0T26DRAFT_769787 [Lasiosphaeria miniovina]KAK0721885.1 hypothetical protein B0T26DRAFT_769787 [Lasiosphaeria miniovina]